MAMSISPIPHRHGNGAWQKQSIVFSLADHSLTLQYDTDLEGFDAREF